MATKNLGAENADLHVVGQGAIVPVIVVWMSGEQGLDPRRLDRIAGTALDGSLVQNLLDGEEGATLDQPVDARRELPQ